MADNTLNSNNTVFFSTANNSYISRAASSLLSVRTHLPDAKLYIISKQISPKNKKILDKHGIQYIELDLTYLFFQTWDYPIECYYLFAGPKIFHNLGYKYSVYLDGDTICLKNPIKDCPKIPNIGGVAANTFSDIFGPDVDSIKRIFKVSPKSFLENRIQTGIIYMNNSTLNKIDFLKQIGDLFYQSWQNGIPRKGDDSLFALFMLKNHQTIKPKYLPKFYNYMPHYQKHKVDKSIIFFHFSLDKPWKIHPYKHQDANLSIYNEYVKKWRSYYKKVNLINYLQSLYFCDITKKLFHKLSRFFSQSKYVLAGTRYSIFKKRHNLKKPPINLYWWQPPHINNFGDIVTKDIILNIFGRQSNYSSLETCDLMATGSIIELLQQTNRSNKLYVWGSGFIRKDSGEKNLEKSIFKAVRGNKTKSRLKLSVPTGDPGILIGPAYGLSRKKHCTKIGVIIHYADFKTPIVKRFCEDNRFIVISPLNSPINVAKQISECKLVLSSSLHGLIFSDSLSVPNYHIKISNNLTGGKYKFQDYYSGIDKKYHPANLEYIFDSDYLQNLIDSYSKIPHLSKKQRSLIKAFPFH